eukprot:TRINITY_DN917_c0_g1_i14.p2 TRINITY_DN917_c0_g1~~TRINITY_DN917_c0_g1_i14.p2  ORF type:complete len:179 (-),score=98.39 TRINITY_DN917_c0_g1_i14:88-624(-)
MRVPRVQRPAVCLPFMAGVPALPHCLGAVDQHRLSMNMRAPNDDAHGRLDVRIDLKKKKQSKKAKKANKQAAAAAAAPAVQEPEIAAPAVQEPVAPPAVQEPVIDEKQAVPEPVVVPEPAPSAPAAPEEPAVPEVYAKWANELAILRRMGFVETNLNAYLLQNHKGDVSAVLEWLLSN